jgi:phospholipid/cholesterol/gamma-HCH transport system substrate-binding protein
MADEDTTAVNRRQTRRTLFGLAIIGGLAGAALLVFFLGDIITAFQRRYDIVALVPDAPGIAPGTPVWVSGREVGTVRKVAILPSSADSMGRIAVTLDLPRKVQSQVRSDSRVRVTSVSMISEAVIDILPGTPGWPELLKGDTLRTDPRPTREQIMAQASRLRAQLTPLLEEARELAPLASLRMEQAQLAFAGMDGAMAELRRMQADMRANPGLALVRDPAFQRSLEDARNHAAALPATFATLQQRLGTAGEVGEAVGRLRTRADTLVAELEAAAALLDQSAGTLGRLQNDAALQRAVGAARASLDSLMAEVRRNPLRFVF